MLADGGWGLKSLPLTTNHNTRPPAYQTLLDTCHEAKLEPIFTRTHITSSIVWEHAQTPLDPIHYMPYIRAVNKRNQIDNIINALEAILHSLIHDDDRMIHVVDFCGGSGHITLPIAAQFHGSITVTLIDINPEALSIAKSRQSQLGLDNVQFLEGSIADYEGAFDIGIGLHACGMLTDWVLRKCFYNRASFIVVPCCVGKLERMSREWDQAVQYPQSQAFAQTLEEHDFFRLAKHGDYSGFDSAVSSCRRRACKALVEYDRLLAAEDRGYTVYLMKLDPVSCTPKNDMIIASPLQLDLKIELNEAPYDYSSIIN